MSVKKVNKDEFDSEAKEGKLLFVDFSATWCGPCQMFAPIFEELAEEYKDNDKISFLSVDIDKNMDLASQYSVMSVPTLLFIKENVVLETMIGAKSKDMLVDKIEELIK